MARNFYKPEFFQTLAYLANAFTALNELNFSLRKRGISILIACEKLSANKKKLLLWRRSGRKENLVHFQNLSVLH